MTEIQTLAPRCQPTAHSRACSRRRPPYIQALVPRPRCLCLLGPQAPPLYPSGISLPVTLLTTRCSTPGGPDTALVTTAKATQKARAQARLPIAGAGAKASSGGARGHIAPHGPAWSPERRGHRLGVCGRPAAHYQGGPGAQGWKWRWPSPAPGPLRPPAAPPTATAQNSRAAWRRLPPPRRGPSDLPLPSLGAAEPSEGGSGGKLSSAGCPHPSRARWRDRSGSEPAARSNTATYLPRPLPRPSRPAHQHGGRQCPTSCALSSARCPPAQSLPSLPPAVGSPRCPQAPKNRTTQRQLPALLRRCHSSLSPSLPVRA